MIESRTIRELPSRARRDAWGPFVRTVIATARTFNAHHHLHAREPVEARDAVHTAEASGAITRSARSTSRLG